MSNVEGSVREPKFIGDAKAVLEETGYPLKFERIPHDDVEKFCEWCKWRGIKPFPTSYQMCQKGESADDIIGTKGMRFRMYWSHDFLLYNKDNAIVDSFGYGEVKDEKNN